MLVAKIQVFLQTFADDPLQFGRQIRIQSHSRNRCAVQNGVKDHACSLATEGQCSGCGLVEHYAEGEQIRARAQFLTRALAPVTCMQLCPPRCPDR